MFGRASASYVDEGVLCKGVYVTDQEARKILMFHSFQWRCIACFLLSEEAPRPKDPSARTIGRADLDGTRAETLLTTESPYKPHGMALDLAGGWLYWVDHGHGERSRS